MKWRDGFGLWPKQTGAQSGEAAGERRAREAGKPGVWARRRGEAAWPNARSAKGRYLPCDTRSRAGEAVRQLAPHSERCPPLTFSPEPGAIAQASQAMQEPNKVEGVCAMTPKWPEITEGHQDGLTLHCPILHMNCIWPDDHAETDVHCGGRERRQCGLFGLSLRRSRRSVAPSSSGWTKHRVTHRSPRILGQHRRCIAQQCPTGRARCAADRQSWPERQSDDLRR
ncbi:hypothetical protein LA6_005943 (plasmid) [Marinibacterium anthonyi]|nr:hypothetical protein LA6_005943 [Marinibacterium anthonyi]